MSIATNIECREPADVHRVHPTCDGVRFDTFRIIGAAQIETAELINIRINESRQSFEPETQEGDDDASDR